MKRRIKSNQPGEDICFNRKRLDRGNAVTARDIHELFGISCDDYNDIALGDLNRKELGDIGEFIAACMLVDDGLEIIEHSYRCREGEADLVAFDRGAEEVVLVEVKTRRIMHLDDPVFPEEAVDYRKRARYRRIAGCFLMDYFPVPSIRFDVMGISVIGDHIAGVEIYRGAFDWDADR